jgi:hypothetical protein
MWGRFCFEVQRQGWAMVWRLELQARKQPHWHTCFYVKPDGLPDEFEPNTQPAADWLKYTLWRYWARALNVVGTAEWFDKRRNRTFLCLRSDVPFADHYSIDVQWNEGPDSEKWRRYLLDHASKSKQEQVATAIGRHWGIVGRSRFVEVAPDRVEQLSDEASEHVLRALQKIQRRRVKDKGADGKSGPWATKLGFRSRAGVQGESVWNGQGTNAARLVEWAKREFPVQGPGDEGGTV